MTEFSDLKSVYDHLEERALDYKYAHQIANIFQKVRDKMHEKENAVEEAKVQWEVDFFNFSLEDDVAKPMYTLTNKNGKEISYPNFERFDDVTYEYLSQRLESSINPLLKARYAHIMWLSPRKHGKYAQMAIDSYLELVKLYGRKDKEKPTEHYGLDIINSVRNAFFLSLQIRDTVRLDIVRSEIRRLIFDFNAKSSSFFIVRANLTELMVKEKERFSKEDCKGIEKVLLQFAEKLKTEDELHKSITILKLGEKIDIRLRKTTANWKKLIAESYESLMRSNIGRSSLVAISFCQDALKYYRQAKEAKKVRELEKEYGKLRKSIEFKEFKVEIDLKDHIKACRKIAEKIAQKSPEEIISILMLDKGLIPKYHEMKELAEKELKEHPIQGIFPIEIFDERGHTAQHFSTKEEITYYKILHTYQLYLETNYVPLVNSIIFEVLKQGKITFDTLMNYFETHSWFGTVLKRKTQNNREIEYRWIELIAPSLYEYFRQMNYYLASENYPVLVTAIESLILKIEGLVRDLCNLSGITTFYQTKDKQGRNIFRERDLNALLHEERLQKIFDEDDLLFLKFVLVEKAGYNLRHKVAHSLMFFREYTINYMHLLILLLLKIGRFKLKSTTMNK